VRRAAKRDEAEGPIVEALQAIGALCWRLNYPCDLLVRHRERWHLLEVKTGRGVRLTVPKDKRQSAQAEFIAATGTPIVRTPQEALHAIGVIA
jgi:hypothetical protein